MAVATIVNYRGYDLATGREVFLFERHDEASITTVAASSVPKSEFFNVFLLYPNRDYKEKDIEKKPLQSSRDDDTV